MPYLSEGKLSTFWGRDHNALVLHNLTDHAYYGCELPSGNIWGFKGIVNLVDLLAGPVCPIPELEQFLVAIAAREEPGGAPAVSVGASDEGESAVDATCVEAIQAKARSVNLTDLPPELIYQIAGHIDDLKVVLNLATTCVRLLRILTPEISQIRTNWLQDSGQAGYPHEPWSFKRVLAIRSLDETPYQGFIDNAKANIMAAAERRGRANNLEDDVAASIRWLDALRWPKWHWPCDNHIKPGEHHIGDDLHMLKEPEKTVRVIEARDKLENSKLDFKQRKLNPSPELREYQETHDMPGLYGRTEWAFQEQLAGIDWTDRKAALRELPAKHLDGKPMLVGKKHFRIINLDTKEHIDTNAASWAPLFLPRILFWSVFYRSGGVPAPWAGHRLSYEAIPYVQRYNGKLPSSREVERPLLETIDVWEKLWHHFVITEGIARGWD